MQAAARFAPGMPTRKMLVGVFTWYHGEEDVRGMLGVMVEGVGGGDEAAVSVQRLTGVGVDVEAGEIAAGDIDANAVAFLEDVGGGVELDGEGIDLPGSISFSCLSDSRKRARTIPSSRLRSKPPGHSGLGG